MPNKTTYKTNGPFSPDSVLGGGYYTWNAYTANINGNPLPSNGILSPPSVNFGLGMSFVNNISIRVTVIDEVRIEPIPFILDMVSLGNSAFITPLPLPYGQISTVTLPLSFGQIANSWTLSIILPNGTTITLQSFGDGKGNATFWWQNNMVGSYFLTATNSFSIPNTSVNGNWSTSIRYSVNAPQTAKYKKLIKKSAILAKNKQTY